MAERRNKGLCYRCDEVYTQGHICKQKHIYLMITEEEEISSAEEQDPEVALVVQGE